MYKLNIFAVALFSLSALVAAETPAPACVLACVNQASSPSNYKEICETKVSTTWSCLKTACAGDNYEAASKHVQERCKGQDITVDMKKAAAATATTTKSGSTTKETGSSTDKDDTTTEDKKDAEKNSAVRLGGSFGALAIALTVMGAMSF